MNKITGKALSLVLSLALVVSSFSASFASASSSHTVSGKLSDTDRDKIYAVSGESKDANLVVDSDIQDYIFNGKVCTLETSDHQHTETAKIYAVSHSSGDRLVKWYDASDTTNFSKGIDDDTNAVGLKLRSDSVKGHETLNILYKATYTDDNEKEVTIKGTKVFDVYVYAKGQPVIADTSYLVAGSDNNNDVLARKKTIELQDDFTQKLLSHETGKSAAQDNKTLQVYYAMPTNVGQANESTVISWTALKTVSSKDKVDDTPITGDFYTLKSSSDCVTLTTSGSGVLATASGKTSGNVTFTATAQKNAKDMTNPKLSTTKDITMKSKVDKKVKVDALCGAFNKIGKYSGNTYISDEALSSDAVKDSGNTFKINGYDVDFEVNSAAGSDVTVDDKASVTKISGKIGNLNIATGSVDSISLDNLDNKAVPSISVSEAKVGDIAFGDDKVGKLTVDSTKAEVGNITNAYEVDVNSGKTGNITADDTVNIKADDDSASTVVGDVKTKTITIDSEDSSVKTGTLTASDDSAEFTLTGSNVTVKAIDLDNRNASLKFDDYQGKVPAPVNAAQDGANISTTNSDDKVEVVGDVAVNAVSIDEDSTLAFDGKVDVSSVDGGGTMVIGAGKMNVTGSVNSTILKLSDANFTKGTTVFTATADTVEPDDFTGFGFTLAKTAGTKTDTFKVDTIVFKGLAINKASDEIAKGYSATYTAGSYPAGMTLPAGYTIQWSLEDANDQVFSLTNNADGSVTVKAIGFDTEFASENKATLQAQLVDADGNTNDDYTAGTCDLVALAVPSKNYTSDTNGTVNMKVGGSYQFKITSSDGSVPTFVIAGNGGAIVTATSKSGNDYFYKVTALKAGDYGVYVNGTTRTAVLHITSDATIDASAVTIKAGSTYQFKVTSSAKPTFGLGGGAAAVVSSSSNGNNYFFKVKAAGKAGDKVGVYVNGARVAVITVG